MKYIIIRHRTCSIGCWYNSKIGHVFKVDEAVKFDGRYAVKQKHFWGIVPYEDAEDITHCIKKNNQFAAIIISTIFLLIIFTVWSIQ